jgi:hypothetical protein
MNQRTPGNQAHRSHSRQSIEDASYLSFIRGRVHVWNCQIQLLQSVPMVVHCFLRMGLGFVR